MTNPTLADLRTTVRRRARVSKNDRSFADDKVNRAIQMAANDLAGVNSNGWWFHRIELTQQNTLGDIALWPVVMADVGRTVDKIGYVFVSLDGHYWTRIERRERLDSIRAAGGRMAAAGVPLTFSQQRIGKGTGGTRKQIGLAFEPPLPAEAWVRVGVVATPVDVVDDADVMFGFPISFMGAIVEAATTRLERTRRGQGALISRRRYVTPVTMADTARAGWEKALKLWWNAPYLGSGQTTIERA